MAEGQLSLGQLNNPGRALSAFSAARRIRPNGPLDAEARFGRGVALNELGQIREARKEWRALIAKHPNSTPAKRAERRLKATP